MSTPSRRELLHRSLAAASLLASAPLARALNGASAPQAAEAAASGGKPQSLRILILGGTGFIGPHLVECARERGHTLTLYNRGKTNAGIFPDIEQLHGDRNAPGGLDVLANRQWDVAIDTNGYFPRQARASCKLLAPNVRSYCFVSSVSVYADFSKTGMAEDAPLAQSEVDDAPKITGENYGAFKALCEAAAEQHFPGRALQIRPGYIVGRGDPTDRFTYWPVRVARGGAMCAPGRPTDPVQFIDVRDLAAFTIGALEQGKAGAYNATGPAAPLGLGALIEACAARTKSKIELHWADEELLSAQQLSEVFPIWSPPTGEYAGYGAIDVRKALRDGMKLRPLDETIDSTLAWWNELPAERRAQPKAGPKPEQEQALLAALSARK